MENGNGPWTPERIRSLRGELSRAEFAEKLGVGALTVYRWELPDGAPEARRPRGAIARRLAALIQPAAASATPAIAPRVVEPIAPEAPADDELHELVPILDRLLAGELARVEADLLALFASGRLRTVGGRALATQALARYQLWSRGDAIGAFATLMPVIQQANDGLLPPSVELEVHVSAALLFASFDGRVLDAGKINAHVARAERLLTPQSDAQRFLLWLAQLLGAYIINDPPLIEHVLARREEIDRDMRWPVLRYFAIEVRLILSYFARQPGRAAEDFQELLELTAKHKLFLFHIRALANAARHAVDEGHPPERALALVQRANTMCREASLAVGLHLMMNGYAEAEARLRSGQLCETEQTLLESLRFCEEIRWAPSSLGFFLVRVLLLTGRGSDVRALADRIVRARCDVYPGIMQGLREAMVALADVIDHSSDDDRRAAIGRLGEAVEALDRENAWAFLRRTVVLVNATAAVLAGDERQARTALQHAERTLEAIPSLWGNTALIALRGLHLFRAGRHGNARSFIEAAIEAFDAAGDRPSGALARRVLALIAIDLDEPDAAKRLDASSAELAGLGIVTFSALEQRAAPVSELEAAGSTQRTKELAQACQRLTERGLSVELVQRELVAIASAMAPGVSVRLDRVESAGASPARARGAGDSVIEFGDGAGRRFRLSATAAGGSARDEDRDAVLAILASVAGLAMEVVTLRGLSMQAQSAVPDVATPELPGFIAASAAMRRLKGELARLARSRSTIIITGESGAGKEVVARALHDLSVRASRPYVAFNCAAVPRELFEGQLFGYRKGAFTGAASDHLGVIRAAQGGTLFLDEIGELPLEVQPKLLRFLENGEIFPLGEQRPVNVDVRVIAATFRELEKLVRDGRFREDLFYRLQVVPIRVPPLRERPEDVVALARFFVAKLTPPGVEPPVIAPGALAALTSHGWPGNVRELRNVIERSLAFEPLPAVLDGDHLRIT